MRYKTTILLFYTAKWNKKRYYLSSFRDFMTGINTKAAEMASVRMIGPSIRSQISKQCSKVLPKAA